MVTPSNVSSTPVRINDHELYKTAGRIRNEVWICEECGEERVDSQYYNDFTCQPGEGDDE